MVSWTPLFSCVHSIVLLALPSVLGAQSMALAPRLLFKYYIVESHYNKLQGTP